MVLLYMVTFTINKPAPWILWVWGWVKTYELPLWEEWHPAQLLGLLGFHRGFSQVCAPLRPLASRWVRKPESGRNHGIWWKKYPGQLLLQFSPQRKSGLLMENGDFIVGKWWFIDGKWWFIDGTWCFFSIVFVYVYQRLSTKVRDLMGFYG